MLVNTSRVRPQNRRAAKRPTRAPRLLAAPSRAGARGSGSGSRVRTRNATASVARTASATLLLAGGVLLDGSRELSLADSSRGLHVSSTRTRSGSGTSAVALEDDTSQLLAALAANDLLGVLNALYSMLLSSGSSWRRLLGATANDASPSHRDTSYLLLEVSSALPAECLQPIGSLRVALSAFRFMNELAATNLSILQVSV